jgi:hypothetical protein
MLPLVISYCIVSDGSGTIIVKSRDLVAAVIIESEYAVYMSDIGYGLRTK